MFGGLRDYGVLVVSQIVFVFVFPSVYFAISPHVVPTLLLILNLITIFVCA